MGFKVGARVLDPFKMGAGKAINSKEGGIQVWHQYK